MVRGCQKKMIHLRDTGSELFEEAFFILKPGPAACRTSEADMVREARRIIECNRGGGRALNAGRTARDKKTILAFLAGAASAGVLTAVVLWIAGLL